MNNDFRLSESFILPAEESVIYHTSPLNIVQSFSSVFPKTCLVLNKHNIQGTCIIDRVATPLLFHCHIRHALIELHPFRITLLSGKTHQLLKQVSLSPLKLSHGKLVTERTDVITRWTSPPEKPPELWWLPCQGASNTLRTTRFCCFT